MQARVLRFTIKPDQLSTARDVIETGVVPLLRAQPGFVRGALLLDRPSGDALTVVIWESADALQAWEDSPKMRQQMAQFMPVLVGAPQREVYDIAYRIPIEGAPVAARTIGVRVRSGSEDGVVNAYTSIVEGSLKNQPGFSAALLLIDPANGAGLSISAWDSDAAMRANDDSGAVQASLARVAEHFSEPPRIRNWELHPMR
jgi:quinol monooxygenase YgiN